MGTERKKEKKREKKKKKPFTSFRGHYKKGGMPMIRGSF